MSSKREYTEPALTKGNYFSGFLYHPASQQILLQQNLAEAPLTWTLLGSANVKDFQTVCAKLLNVKLPPKNILPIYNYIHKGTKYFVSYTEIKDLKDYPAKGKLCFTWLTLKQISKLPLSEQTKQDIIVGRRVIDSGIRRDTGERTIG